MSMSKKSHPKQITETYSAGDAQCSNCLTQTNSLTVVNKKELCYACAKAEWKKR